MCLPMAIKSFNWANSHKLGNLDEVKKVTAGDGPVGTSHPVVMKLVTTENAKSGIIVAKYERALNASR